jgi:hypothetical protein
VTLSSFEESCSGGGGDSRGRFVEPLEGVGGGGGGGSFNLGKGNPQNGNRVGGVSCVL